MASQFPLGSVLNPQTPLTPAQSIFPQVVLIPNEYANQLVQSIQPYGSTGSPSIPYQIAQLAAAQQLNALQMQQLLNQQQQQTQTNQQSLPQLLQQQHLQSPLAQPLQQPMQSQNLLARAPLMPAMPPLIQTASPPLPLVVTPSTPSSSQSDMSGSSASSDSIRRCMHGRFC